MLTAARFGHPAETQTAGSFEDWRTWTGRQRIPSKSAAVALVRDELLAVLQHLKWIARDIFAVGLAVEEALANAVKHGGGNRMDRVIHFAYEASSHFLRVEIADSGDGFDRLQVSDPRRDENLTIPSGRGLLLMTSYMDRVEFNQQGNRVILEKRATDE
jgi:serine/threonine-protein kinase RsbW